MEMSKPEKAGQWTEYSNNRGISLQREGENWVEGTIRQDDGEQG